MLILKMVGCLLFGALLTGMGLNPTSHAAEESHSPATVSASKAFPVRGFHLTLGRSVKECQAVMDQAAALGYNTFIMALSPHGTIRLEAVSPGKIRFSKGTADDLRTLVAYARKIGLEPVLELKIVGKQKMLMGELARQYPGLITTGKSEHEGVAVLNPGFRFPDGSDPYTAAVLPAMDEMISMFGDLPPRYFLLGTDEASVDGLTKVGRPLGWSAAEVLADGINRCVAHLEKKGITPIIWGDMLLSPKLVAPGHGVKGFDYDPRFSTGGSLHGEFFSTDGASTVTAMNYLKQRDKIIIVNWQYGPTSTGEYPAIDYFQTLGFKNVWGCTWYTEENVRQFSRYAAQRGCGGMIASTWHTWFSTKVKHLFAPTLSNSILYYRNPYFEPPAALPYQVGVAGSVPMTAARTVVTPPQAKEVNFSVEVPTGTTPKDGEVWLGDRKKVKLTSVALKFDPTTRCLRGTIPLSLPEKTLPYCLDLGYRYQCTESGYIRQELRRAALVIGKRQPISVGNARTDALLMADFSNLQGKDLAGGLLQIPGKCGGVLVMEGVTKAAIAVNGSLDCGQISSTFVYPEGDLWKYIDQQGMRLVVEFQLTGKTAGKEKVATVISFGRFDGGFRLNMFRESTLQLQLAKTADGTWPISTTIPDAIEKGKWITATITVSQFNGIVPRTATLQVNGAPAVTTVLPCEMDRPDSPLGFGVEFDDYSPGQTPWPSFPGKLRRVEIRTLSGK